MVQLPQPSWQVELQTPAAQLCDATWEALHARLHAPQLKTSVAVLDSQPSVAMRLQSPNPAVHEATAQEPPLHAARALGSEQVVLHAPQLATSVSVFTSQPSATTVLQFSQEPVQEAMVQTLLTHAEVALGRLQVRPQEPQFDSSVFKSTHSPLQSVSPAAQVSEQVPLLQNNPGPHLVPQVPQLSLSLSRFTSQPVEATLSQSA